MTTNHPDEIQAGPAGVLPNGLKISSDMSAVSRQLYISNKDGTRIVDLDDKDQGEEPAERLGGSDCPNPAQPSLTL